MLLYQEDAELLFPARVIPILGNLRGEKFQELVEHISQCDSQSDEDVLAFVLMMIRLSSCLTCTADSYRAMNGCTACAKKTVRGYKGTDEDLLHKWQLAREHVVEWLQKQAEAQANTDTDTDSSTKANTNDQTTNQAG